jgi:LPXTG-motif cell wall-anchored protein
MALPQTDTAATLQFVMGLLALAMAAAVMLMGRSPVRAA